MAGNVVYADLKIPGGTSHTNLRREAAGSRCPPWHRRMIWISGVLNILVVLAFIGFVVWAVIVRTVPVRQSELSSSSWSTPCQGSTAEPKCNMWKSQDEMKRALCDPSQDIATGKAKCKLCPMGWIPDQEKCYYVSKAREIRSWSGSKVYCSSWNASLLVIHNQEEKDFINFIVKDSNFAWIGLHGTAHRDKWSWVDGSAFNQPLIPVKGRADESSCVAVKKDTFASESCNNSNNWICQKEAVMI